MAIDPRFYRIDHPVTLGTLGAFLGADIIGATDIEVTDFAPPEGCSAGILCFVSSAEGLIDNFHNGIVITCPDLIDKVKGAAGIIGADNPRLAFARAVAHCLAVDHVPAHNPPKIDPSARISASSVIADGVQIGANTTIGANSVINAGVQIGDDCHIGDNCSLGYCELADGCDIQSGVVIGSAGFGFEMTGSAPVKIPHIGIVRLGRGVFVGANSAIDRGSLDNTVIGQYVMIDNLVHIAHNCQIGDNCVIAGQVGIAGSTVLGPNVVIGGQAGIADHLQIGDGAVILARSGVTKNVDDNAKMVGFPAVEAGQYWRDQAVIRKLLRAQGNEKKKG